MQILLVGLEEVKASHKHQRKIKDRKWREELLCLQGEENLLGNVFYVNDFLFFVFYILSYPI